MIDREIIAKSILSKSQVYDDVANPCEGCSHAAFMTRVAGYKEQWGETPGTVTRRRV